MNKSNIIKFDEHNSGRYTRTPKNKISKPFFSSHVQRSNYIGTAEYVSYDYYDHNGGGNMDNYITRPEFEEYKRHLDTRFDGVSKDITIAKNEVIDKIDTTRKSDKRWFVGLAWTTGITLLGVIVAIVGLILQIAGVI